MCTHVVWDDRVNTEKYSFLSELNLLNLIFTLTFSFKVSLERHFLVGFIRQNFFALFTFYIYILNVFYKSADVLYPSAPE